MAHCACGGTAQLRAILIHDLSDFPIWRIVALTICSECIEKHRFYCAGHMLFKICVTQRPPEVYAARPEVLSRVCHRCVLDNVRGMSAEEKRNIVFLIETTSSLDIISCYIPQRDRHMLEALNPIDLTVFGLSFGAELDGMTLHEMVGVVAKLKRAKQEPARRPRLN